MDPPVLSIAGSDPSGGAGIQADLKTFAALQCYGMAAITALTVQNTRGVHGVHAVSPLAVEEQITAVLDDIPPKAIKIGMLYSEAIVRAVVRALNKQELKPALVVDPVIESTSGRSLLSPSAVDTIISDLFPMATLVTPNKAEAEILLSRPGKSKFVIDSLETMILAARKLLDLGPKAILVKNGQFTVTMDQVRAAHDESAKVPHEKCHILGENISLADEKGGSRQLVVNVLCEKGSTVLLVRPHIVLESTHGTHGTGCTLSAAIAAELACGAELKEAVRKATAYTHIAIEQALAVGGGLRPLHHHLQLYTARDSSQCRHQETV